MKKIISIILVLFIAGCDQLSRYSLIVKQDCAADSQNVKFECARIVQNIAQKNNFEDVTESSCAANYTPDILCDKQTCKLMKLYTFRPSNTSRWLSIGQFDCQDKVIVELKGWGLPQEFSDVRNQLKEELTN